MDSLKNKTFAFYILCVLSYFLCLIADPFSVASAQRVKVYVEEDSKAGVNIIEVRDDVIIADEKVEIIDADVPTAEDKVSESEIEKAEERDTDGDSPDSGSQEGQPRRDRQPRRRSGERFPPEVREMMEEEGISPEELMKNPELRRRFREKVESMRGEDNGGSESDGESAEGERRRGRRERGSADEELKRYVDVIVKKNLFLQLGSGGEKKKTSYALTAVISNASEGSDDKAIIEERGGGRSYYVSEGDTFANEVKVEDIEEEVVELDRSGERMTLRLGEGTEGGRQGGRRGGGGRGRSGGEQEGRPGGEGKERGSDERGGDDFDPGEIPPFVQRILKERGISMEDLRRDPELRQNLRREFEERARRGEFGGGRERPVRVRRR